METKIILQRFKSFDDYSSIVSYMAEIDFTKAYSEKVGCAIKKVNLSGNKYGYKFRDTDSVSELDIFLNDMTLEDGYICYSNNLIKELIILMKHMII